ncbi:MAG: acyclic terpene utilization AtuA family protein [Gemmataceae bacterium]
MSRRVRIGNASGFWGDNLDAPILLAQHGQLDYLTLEYLAELTMSILALQRQRDPTTGFARDFLDTLRRLTPQLRDQPNFRIITNAGGMNPAACAAQARTLLDEAGLADRRIGIVTGDDLLPRLDELLATGHALAHLDSGQPLETIRSRVVSANAYLGCAPIVEALSQGASVVITGRVADASLTAGPAVFEHGWHLDDWDRLAAATVAGHLIECGAQATGGLWCHWDETDLAHVGYPFVDLAADGTFTLGKPSGTGGAVNIETASEQLLYEVGDPAAYLTPDVVADFTSVTLTETAPDTVRVTGARGRPAPERLKVSIAYRDGWTAAGTLVIAGPDARTKARRAAEMILARLDRAGARPEQHHIECLGSGDSLPGVLPTVSPPEVVLRLAVRDTRKAIVERFTRELAPLVTSGPPGVTGYTTGRPVVREVFAYWPALLDRHAVAPAVRLV